MEEMREAANKKKKCSSTETINFILSANKNIDSKLEKSFVQDEFHMN